MPRTQLATTAKGRSKAQRRPQPASMTLISSTELERVRKGADNPEAFLLAEKELAIQRYEAQMAAERDAQKQQDEEVKKQSALLSESDQLRAEEDKAIRIKAALQLEEQKDEVKRMNQMLLYSKCAAIRDQQVEEKRLRLADEKARQKSLDADIESRRQQQILAQEEEERVRFERRREGMAVLEEQLEEHEQQRRSAKEQKRQEQAKLNAAIELARETEARLLLEKKAAGAALLEEVMAGNAVMIERKKAQKAKEIEEELRILAYTREQDAKAQAALEEKSRQAKAREMETARLRALQEKAHDRRSQLDELRAKRWQEAAARKERELAQQAAEKAAAQQASLMAARQAQSAARLVAQAALAKAEAADFEATLRKLRTEKAQLEAKEAEEAAERKAYLADLQQQVQGKEAVQAATKQALLAEGKIIKERLEKEKAEIERIRQKKLQQMAVDKIPQKYHSKLARERFVSDAVIAV